MSRTVKKYKPKAKPKKTEKPLGSYATNNAASLTRGKEDAKKSN